MDNNPEIDVAPDEYFGRLRHAVAEGIVLIERRHIADRLVWVGLALVALAAVTLAAGLPDYAGVALAGGGIAVLFESLWLRFGRPQSVKPWRAEE